MKDIVIRCCTMWCLVMVSGISYADIGETYELKKLRKQRSMVADSLYDDYTEATTDSIKYHVFDELLRVQQQLIELDKAIMISQQETNDRLTDRLCEQRKRHQKLKLIFGGFFFFFFLMALALYMADRQMREAFNRPGYYKEFFRNAARALLSPSHLKAATGMSLSLLLVVISLILMIASLAVQLFLML